MVASNCEGHSENLDFLNFMINHQPLQKVVQIELSKSILNTPIHIQYNYNLTIGLIKRLRRRDAQVEAERGMIGGRSIFVK